MGYFGSALMDCISLMAKYDCLSIFVSKVGLKRGSISSQGAVSDSKGYLAVSRSKLFMKLFRHTPGPSLMRKSESALRLLLRVTKTAKLVSFRPS